MSTGTPRTGAAEVPLLERLDSVPMNGRAILNNGFESRSIPYGNLCYLAAQEIRRLQVELSRVTAECDTLAKAFADETRKELAEALRKVVEAAGLISRLMPYLRHQHPRCVAKCECGLNAIIMEAGKAAGVVTPEAKEKA